LFKIGCQNIIPLFVVVHVSWDDVRSSFHIALSLIVNVGISGLDCILLRDWACLLRFKQTSSMLDPNYILTIFVCVCKRFEILFLKINIITFFMKFSIWLKTNYLRTNSTVHERLNGTSWHLNLNSIKYLCEGIHNWL